MISRSKSCYCIGLLVVLSGVQAVGQSFSVDGSGNVDAQSYSGVGSDLTGVPTQLFHGYFELDCPASSTCLVFANCAAVFEVSGGGFFINSANQSLRNQVTLHQSYRQTVTQWKVEATNNSAEVLKFGAVPECVLVPSAPDSGLVEQQSFQRNSPLPTDETLLLCPHGDTSQLVSQDVALRAHYCPNDGAILLPYGGRVFPQEEHLVDDEG